MSTLFRGVAAYLLAASAAWYGYLAWRSSGKADDIPVAVILAVLWAPVPIGAVIRAGSHRRAAGRGHWVAPAVAAGAHAVVSVGQLAARGKSVVALPAEEQVIVGFWLSTFTLSVAGLALDRRVGRAWEAATEESHA